MRRNICQGEENIKFSPASHFPVIAGLDVARLESGRGQPSTRTLLRFAKATGHRLKISFQPMRGKRE